ALDGPADPIASAPSTANGRQLSIAGFAATQESIEKPNFGGEEKPVVQEKAAAKAPTAIAERTTPTTAKRELRDVVRDAIVDSFYAVNNGASIDWLLADPMMQNAFHGTCRNSGLIGGPFDWNRELLRFRKTGEFPKRGQIKKVHIADEELDSYNFAAEI